MMDWFYLADLAGVAVFAISGTLLAFRKQMDGFGVVVLASVTGVGGGTTRDLILDQPVFWLHDATYFLVILAAAGATIVWLRYKAYLPLNRLQLADALGIAFFAMLGAERALQAEVGPATAIIMGTMTAVFGGMLRDVLAREIPMVLKSELYATACIAGAAVFVLVQQWHPTTAMVLSMLVTLTLRLGALRYHWSLPVFRDSGPS